MREHSPARIRIGVIDHAALIERQRCALSITADIGNARIGSRDGQYRSLRRIIGGVRIEHDAIEDARITGLIVDLNKGSWIAAGCVSREMGLPGASVPKLRNRQTRRKITVGEGQRVGTRNTSKEKRPPQVATIAFITPNSILIISGDPPCRQCPTP